MVRPKTLQAAIKYFSDEQVCIDTIAALRWPDGPACPACGHKGHYYLKTQKRWKCKECYKQFTVKLGTVFEDSPISLNKWLIALWMLVNCKNGISSYEVGKDLGITQKSAWFVLQRLRLALQGKSFVKLGGSGSEVEVDETFIGGKARFMHKNRRIKTKVREGNWGKAIVTGMLERDGKVHAQIIPDRKKEALSTVINAAIDKGSMVYTDEHVPYPYTIGDDYAHKIVNHLENREETGRFAKVN
jgi:transposase-like protein